MKSSSKARMVSVIIPTRNEEDAIEKLLKSLKAQTYKNFEILVIDGGSTDNTEGVAKKYGARFIRETGKYKSPANARNLGVKGAKGDIIAVFDCDSEVNDKFIEEGVKQFSSDKVMGITSSYILAEDTWVEKTLASKLKTHALKPGTPVFTRRGFVNSLGGWDATLGYGEDRSLLRKIMEYDEKSKHQSIKHAKGAVIKTHLPHTLIELFGQQRWYGRTILHYLKKYGDIKEYLTLLKAFYVVVLFAVIMAVFQAGYWLPMMVVSAPFILMSLYRTINALAHGKIWGLGIFFLDIIMGIFFAYGLSEYFFRSERGRE
jgi:glycosyltransferase involved in cell wall biosynthesis